MRGGGGGGGPKSGLRRSVIFGEAILCTETSREMCQGERNCPGSGELNGDVSGKKTFQRGAVLGDTGTVKEDVSGEKSCPFHGSIKGGVSGEKKLSSPWEYQRRCVRGKETVQAVGNSMEMYLGKRLFKEGRSLAIQELSRKMCQGEKAVQPTGISKEMCQGKRSCPVHGSIKGDVSGKRSCPFHRNIKGDVSGEKNLSSQWETQWRCIRGKDFSKRGGP